VDEMPAAPGTFEEAVRPYQLPQTSPVTSDTAQYNLAANQPIVVTPGFGGSGAGPLPPIQLGKAHFDQTVTSYMDQAASEAREQ
jgi:hypothetical protein